MVKKIAYVRLIVLMDLARCPLSPMAIILATTCCSLILQRIVSVPQGMKSIIVIKSKEVRTMKKILLILILLFTLLLAISLYNTLAQLNRVETGTVEEVSGGDYPQILINGRYYDVTSVESVSIDQGANR